MVPPCSAKCFETLNFSFNVVSLQVEMHPFLGSLGIVGFLEKDPDFGVRSCWWRKFGPDCLNPSGLRATATSATDATPPGPPAGDFTCQGTTSHTGRPFSCPVCLDRVVVRCAKSELPELKGETFRIRRCSTGGAPIEARRTSISPPASPVGEAFGTRGGCPV